MHALCRVLALLLVVQFGPRWTAGKTVSKTIRKPLTENDVQCASKQCGHLQGQEEAYLTCLHSECGIVKKWIDQSHYAGQRRSGKRWAGDRLCNTKCAGLGGRVRHACEQTCEVKAQTLLRSMVEPERSEQYGHNGNDMQHHQAPSGLDSTAIATDKRWVDSLSFQKKSASPVLTPKRWVDSLSFQKKSPLPVTTAKRWVDSLSFQKKSTLHNLQEKRWVDSLSFQKKAALDSPDKKWVDSLSFQRRSADKRWVDSLSFQKKSPSQDKRWVDSLSFQKKSSSSSLPLVALSNGGTSYHSREGNQLSTEPGRDKKWIDSMAFQKRPMGANLPLKADRHEMNLEQNSPPMDKKWVDNLSFQKKWLDPLSFRKKWLDDLAYAKRRQNKKWVDSLSF